ncbi:hypothetical protein SpCBS45565_g03224 [Spizellomyces sp. 'palustris']|nr:hypothetical protein SpCBS45565_g03224 [Spizellomyces sp. 'palustris']
MEEQGPSRLKFKETKRKKKHRKEENTKKRKKGQGSLSPQLPPYYGTSRGPVLYDDGYMPPEQAHKPEFTSLWDDVWDDGPGAAQDYWQANWSNSAYQEPIQETYDDWADRIRASMHEKRYGAAERMTREAEEERARKRKEARAEADREEETRANAHQQKRNDLDNAKLSAARDKYRSGWTKLKAANTMNAFTIKDLPIPSMRKVPISFDSVSKFLFDGSTFTSEQKKRMIKDSLLLWHPDKFARYKRLFKEKEWDTVVDAVNQVSQALNAIHGTLQ